MTLTAEQIFNNEEHFHLCMKWSKSYTWKDYGETFDIKNRRMVAQSEKGYLLLGKVVSKDFMFNFVQPPANTTIDLWEILYPTATSFKCVICKKNTKGYGNNASPSAEGRCCDKCNYAVVLPRRIAKTQMNAIVKTGGKLGEIAEENDEGLLGALTCLIAEGLKEGQNEFSIEIGKGIKKCVRVAPIHFPEFAPNRMTTPPPQTDNQLASLFKKEDLKGIKTHKKHQSKSKIEAREEAEATRLANMDKAEERRRRKEFEKEVAEKAKPQTKSKSAKK